MASPSAVSVVIPTYNRAHLLGRSIGSALRATCEGDEIIVADDASTDNTAEVVTRYGGRVRYLPLPHGGAGATRNAGTRAATKPLIAYLDSDDEWDADKLTIQRAFMDARPDVLYSFTDFRMIDGDGPVQQRYLKKWRPDDPRSWREIMGEPVRYSSILPVPAGREDFDVYVCDLYYRLMETFLISAVTLVVRREEAGEALHFGEDLAFYDDLECFGRLGRAGKGCFLDCETSTQYGHPGPRLTDANTDVLTRTHLCVLGRVWGQDEAFLRQHGPHFRKKVRDQRLLRARWLLVQGRTKEAQQELREAGESPASYRMLAALPGFVTKALLRVRRAVRGS